MAITPICWFPCSHFTLQMSQKCLHFSVRLAVSSYSIHCCPGTDFGRQASGGLWRRIPVASGEVGEFSGRTTLDVWTGKEKMRALCLVRARSRFKTVYGNTSEQDVNNLVRVLTAGGETAAKVLDRHGGRLDPPDWFAVLDGIGRQHRWLLALEVFRWIQTQRWYKPDNGYYCKLISIMGKERQVRRAMWLFSEMMRLGCRADTSLYNSVIAANIRCENKERGFNKALGLLEDMKLKRRCQPNIITYNILSRAAAQLSKFETLEVLLKDMQERKIDPDIYTYNGLLDAYGKAGHCEIMEDILKRMLSEQLKPDEVTFNTLLDAYGRAGCFEKMEEVLVSMSKQKPPIKPVLKTFNSMITNYGKAGELRQIEWVLKKMEDAGITLNLVTYEALITSFGQAGYFEEMASIINEMKRSHISPQISTLHAVMSVYCGHEMFDEAESALINSSQELGVEPTSLSCAIMLRYYKKAGLVQEMKRFLIDMEKFGLEPNKAILLDVLDVLTDELSGEGREFHVRSDTKQEEQKEHYFLQ